MHRIDNASAATSLPTPAAAGTAGYFTAGSPSSGTPATIVDPDWMNDVQEEMISILTSAGITPDKTVHNQLLTAIQNGAGLGSLFAANGYAKLPGGLILQWGYCNIATGDPNPKTFNFPIAFPNGLLAAAFIDGGSGLHTWGLAALSASQFQLWGGYFNGSSATYIAGFGTYIAVGH